MRQITSVNTSSVRRRIATSVESSSRCLVGFRLTLADPCFGNGGQLAEATIPLGLVVRHSPQLQDDAELLLRHRRNRQAAASDELHVAQRGFLLDRLERDRAL